MADAVTTSSTLTLSQVAWEQTALWSLRPELIWNQQNIGARRAGNQSMPGSSVTFTYIGDLAAQTTALSETTDVDAVALSNSTVNIALQEYGGAVVTTNFLHRTSFLPVDPIKANVLGWNAGISHDQIARDLIISTSTTVDYPSATGGTGTNAATVAAGDTMNAAIVRYERNRLARANVQTVGGAYVAFMHPDVILDLRTQTGQGSWRQTMEYGNIMPILNGEVGMFEGVRIIETTRAPIVADEGAGNVDNYITVFMGADSVGFATAGGGHGGGELPEIVIAPPTDHLQRLYTLGWYHIFGAKVLRQTALRKVYTSSSVGANA